MAVWKFVPKVLLLLLFSYIYMYFMMTESICNPYKAICLVTRYTPYKLEVRYDYKVLVNVIIVLWRLLLARFSCAFKRKSKIHGWLMHIMKSLIKLCRRISWFKPWLLNLHFVRAVHTVVFLREYLFKEYIVPLYDQLNK